VAGTAREAGRILRDAAWIGALAAAVGLAFNAVRPGGIPFVAKEAYELFVPCPEPLGEVEALDPADGRLRDPRTLRVDARGGDEFARWHLDGAWNVPFDYLEGVPEATVRRIAASGAAGVVVYGDGHDPDSGRELARELAGRGVRNVGFVRGGAPALGAPGSEAGRPGGEVPR
jgi:hypothetical protein